MPCLAPGCEATNARLRPRLLPIVLRVRYRAPVDSSPLVPESRAPRPQRSAVRSRTRQLLPQHRYQAASLQFFRSDGDLFRLQRFQQFRFNPGAPLLLILTDQGSDELARSTEIARSDSVFHVRLERIGQGNIQGSHGHADIL